jgi:glycosyltransferase involved in cell wall biosynthesis
MRILLVSPYFPPRNAIGALRVHAFARHWAAEGEQVTVLTTRKRDHQRGLELPCEGFELVEVDYPISRPLERLRSALRNGGNGRARDEAASSWPGVKRLLRGVQSHTGIFAARMPDFTDRWVRPAIEWAASQAGWDVVVSSGGPYTAHLVAHQVRRRGLARHFVADFRDLWVDHHAFRGLFPFTLRERALERRCLKAADLVVTVSEELAGVLAAKTRGGVEIIYNGLDPQEIEAIPLERAFSGDDRVRLVYTGALYLAGQDPLPLLRSMAGLVRRRPEVASRLELVVAGPGPEDWARLARRCRALGMVRTCGEVSRPMALRMQRDADALVLLDWKASSPGVLTGKLFDYLGATAPILVVGGCANSSVARMVVASGRGIHLGDDMAAIGQALVDTVDAPQKLRRPPQTDFISTFTRRHQSLRLLEAIRRLSAAPAGAGV